MLLLLLLLLVLLLLVLLLLLLVMMAYGTHRRVFQVLSARGRGQSRGGGGGGAAVGWQGEAGGGVDGQEQGLDLLHHLHDKTGPWSERGRQKEDLIGVRQQ